MSDKNLLLPPPARLVKKHDYYTLYSQFRNDSERKEYEQNHQLHLDTCHAAAQDLLELGSAGSPISSEPSSAVSSFSRNESELGASEAEALEILESLSSSARNTSQPPLTSTSTSTSTTTLTGKWDIYPSPEYPVLMKQYPSKTESKGYKLVYEYTISVDGPSPSSSSSSSSRQNKKQNKQGGASNPQDVITKYTMMMDADSGEVNFTPLARAAGHRNITKNMLSCIPGFSPNDAEKQGRIKKIKSGTMNMRGTWMRFEDAKILASTYCPEIKEKLVLFLGHDFLEASDVSHGPSCSSVVVVGSQPATASSTHTIKADVETIVEDASLLLPGGANIAAVKQASPSPVVSTSFLKGTPRHLSLLPSSNSLPAPSVLAPVISASHPVSNHRFIPYAYRRAPLAVVEANIPKIASTIHQQAPQNGSNANATPLSTKEEEIASGSHLPRFSTLLSSLSEAPPKISAYHFSASPAPSIFAPGLALPSSGLVSISSGHTLADQVNSSTIVEQCYTSSPSQAQAQKGGSASYGAGGGEESGRAGGVIPAPGPASQIESILQRRRQKRIASEQLDDIKRIMFPFKSQYEKSVPDDSVNVAGPFSGPGK